MIVIVAMRSLFARPWRSAVLAGGFGLGVAVMAALLGIGGVILEQARTPELVGGGDVVVGGAGGRLSNAKFILSSVLGAGPIAPRVTAAAPSLRGVVYLVDETGITPVRARGGVPSLERALGDPEVQQVSSWADAASDLDWRKPRQEDVLRSMDRFHVVPKVPARAASWAEWLYFNGRSGGRQFYLTFLAGPEISGGRQPLGVRLQVSQAGHTRAYSESVEVDSDGILRSAPDLAVGRNTVTLSGSNYRIHLDLPGETTQQRAGADIVLRASAGRSLPPFEMQGAGGWVSGYVVPVMSGTLEGVIQIGSERIDLAAGTGYHDHNWGFWDGVTWQWGQVQGPDLSFVYGRVRPPADAADPSRIPGFVVALDGNGPVGFATDVTINETNDPQTSRPRRIVVSGKGEAVDLTMEMDVAGVAVTPMRTGLFGGGLDFLQLRTRYRVTGHVASRPIEFTADGSAETFRGRSPSRGQSP